MSASDLIASFGRPVTITRFGDGSYVSGVYTPPPGPPVNIPNVIMSIQPMTGRELLNVPEAQRTKRWVKGYCAQEVFTADSVLGRRADQITDGNDLTYEVHRVQFWDSTGNTVAPHWYVEMAEVNPV